MTTLMLPEPRVIETVAPALNASFTWDKMGGGDDGSDDGQPHPKPVLGAVYDGHGQHSRRSHSRDDVVNTTVEAGRQHEGTVATRF